MNNKEQIKDLIIGDLHGCAGTINQNIKDIGFETSENPIINIGSPPEQIPEGKIPDAFTILEEVKANIERMQKANNAHHEGQYKKMYPG